MNGPARARRWWWNRLSTKLTAVITIATAIGSSAFLWIVLSAQRQLLMDETIRSAAFLSDTLLNSLQRHMLRNERTELLESLQTVASQPLMSELRLFDRLGKNHFSMDANEIGRVVDTRERTCAACHESGQQVPRALGVAERSRVLDIPGNGRVMVTVTPIYNRTSCSEASCHAHPAEQRVLGILEVGVSLAHADATLASLQRRTAGVALVVILGLAVTSIVFTHRTVVRPVAQLAKGLDRVAAGDLKQPVPVTGSGEIAELAGAFNEMEATLADVRRQRLALLGSLEQQVQDRTAALERAQERLVHTEKLSALGRLSASIAHEINNPLMGILTYAKLIIRTLEGGAPDDRARGKLVGHLKLVERETQRCTAIVRNLLDFARERRLKLTDVNVNDAIGEALSLIQHQVALQNIRLEKDLETVPLMRADFGQIRQALLNVVINACDAMPQGGTLRVTSKAPDAEHILITVQDTGPGISPEHLKKVFDPFFTTREKGNGLGLSVVYGIVERHSGTLHIDSQVGQGTTVRIQLLTKGAEMTAANGALASQA
jgi:two-component system NtrC family sensor kinase